MITTAQTRTKEAAVRSEDTGETRRGGNPGTWSPGAQPREVACSVRLLLYPLRGNRGNTPLLYHSQKLLR
jgi:hypothetical protein